MPNASPIDFTRVPSASIVETQAGQTRLDLRGISTNGVGATVATYVDETPYGSATSLANGGILTPDIDPFDLERVEIPRGPQGTLYGANSLGGLVKVCDGRAADRCLPRRRARGFESVDGGETGWSGRVAVNAPLGDMIAVRGSGFYRTDPGHLDDPVLGPNVNGGKTYGGRGSILVKPSESFRYAARQSRRIWRAMRRTRSIPTLSHGAPPWATPEESRLVAEPNHVKYRVYNATCGLGFRAGGPISSTSRGRPDQAADPGHQRPVMDPLPSDPSVFGHPLGAIINQNGRSAASRQEVRPTSSGASAFEWTLGGSPICASAMRSSSSIDVIDRPDGRCSVPGPRWAGLCLGVAGISRDRRLREWHLSFLAEVRPEPRGRFSHNRQRSGEDQLGAAGGGSGRSTVARRTTSSPIWSRRRSPCTDHVTIHARVARGYRPGRAERAALSGAQRRAAPVRAGYHHRLRDRHQDRAARPEAFASS